MLLSKGKQRPQRRRTRRQQNIFAVPQKPPRNMYKIKLRHTFRYEAITASSIISLADLFWVLGTETATPDTQASAISGLKLKSITMWGVGSTASAPNTISIETVSTSSSSTAGIGSEPFQISDTAYGGNKTPTLKFIPNKNTQFGMWQVPVSATATTGNQAFISFQNSIGDIIDIDMIFYINTGDTVLTITSNQTSTAGTLKNFQLPMSGTQAWTIVD